MEYNFGVEKEKGISDGGVVVVMFGNNVECVVEEGGIMDVVR